MLDAGRQLPTLWEHYARAHADMPQSEGVYVSDSHGGADACLQAIVDAQGTEALMAIRRLPPLDAARSIAPITTLAVWRMTQGIYRFDPTLYETLIDTPLTGDLPADVLMRLPEWCPYLETPGLHVLKRDGGRADLAGVWVRLEYEADGSPVMILTLDIPEAPFPEVHALVLRGTLEQAVSDTLRQWGIADLTIEQGVSSYLRPIINLILYLVGSGDVTGKHGQPGNPAPKRIKGGARLFPVPGVRQWDVGVRMGAALRRAYHAAELLAGTHSGPRPHIRRAHWHSYWTGKAGQPRILKPKWLPPIPVNLDEVDDLPSVIRKI